MSITHLYFSVSSEMLLPLIKISCNEYKPVLNFVLTDQFSCLRCYFADP